jgi:CDP-diacylglycerol--glycerol-3-phosphate 3-phosphatidyltransferase
MNGLYGLKAWFTRMLTPVLNLAVRLGLSPNWLTALGVAGAGLAAWAVLNLNAWLVALGLVIRLAGANLDGAVARARGLGSRSGFWINELGDRASDLIVMAALVQLAVRESAGSFVWWHFAALVFANLPTAVSIWGYLQGKPRLNGGPVGKTERCALAVLAIATIQFGLSTEVALDAFAAVIIFGSLLTATLRYARLRRIAVSR